VDNKLEYFGEYASKREAVAIRHEAVILLRQIESLRSFICDLAA
jgi:hypothetical protein